MNFANIYMFSFANMEIKENNKTAHLFFLSQFQTKASPTIFLCNDVPDRRQRSSGGGAANMDADLFAALPTQTHKRPLASCDKEKSDEEF
jgi:hypothetical protein